LFETVPQNFPDHLLLPEHDPSACVRLRHSTVHPVQLDGTVHILTTFYRTIRLLYDVCYCIDRVLYTSSIFDRIYMYAIAFTGVTVF